MYLSGINDPNQIQTLIVSDAENSPATVADSFEQFQVRSQETVSVTFTCAVQVEHCECFNPDEKEKILAIESGDLMKSNGMQRIAADLLN